MTFRGTLVIEPPLAITAMGGLRAWHMGLDEDHP
jgi:hypothetical protein